MSTFDGDNLLVTLDAPTGGVLNVDVPRFYSEWKEWQLATAQNMGYPLVWLDNLGGQTTSPTEILTASIFFNNAAGWRIQTTDADQEVNFVGNMYLADIALLLITPRAGRSLTVRFDRSVNARDLTSDDNLMIRKIITNRIHTDPVTGIMTVFDDDDVTPYLTAALWKDTSGSVAYDGITGGAERRDQLA